MSNGLDALQQRQRRGRPQPPASRHPRPPAAPADETSPSVEPASSNLSGQSLPVPAASDVETRDRPPEPETEPTPQLTSRAQPRARRPVGGSSHDRPMTTPNEPTANLGVRVRNSIDDRLEELIFRLRRAGVRSSKAEIVEMLIWELPAEPDDDFRKRLARFRDHAPRELEA